MILHMCNLYLKLLLIFSFYYRNFENTPNVLRGSLPQRVVLSGDVVHEVSMDHSFQASPAPATGELKRTINLPKECSKAQ